MKYYPFINGLRAVAVIPVILFHFGIGGVTGGYAGVDVFFVISGFLITGLLVEMLEKDQFSLVRFYERRARRILPALFAACLLSFLAALALFMPQDFREFSRSLYSAALFGSNFTFFRDVSYFAAPAMVKPLLHTWSLAVEEQFYVLYPLALYGIYRWAKGDRRRLSAGIGMIFLASLAMDLCFFRSYPHATFFLLHTRAWELLAGALVYLCLVPRPPRPALAQAMSLAGLSMLAASFFLFDRNTPFPGVAALVPVGGAALVLWADAAHETVVGRLLSSRPFAATGLISYGLYLYHWLLLVFGRYYLDRELTAPESAAALATAGTLAALSYVLVEQPVRQRRILLAPRPLFLSAFLGLALMAAAGRGGIATDGFPHRFPSEVLAYVAEDEPHQNCLAPPEKNATQCMLGDSSARPSFLVWGDSHASRVAPAVDAVASRYHASGWLLTLEGCEPVLGLDYLAKETCRPHNDKVLQFVRDKGIKTVILAGRWDNILPRESGSIEATKADAEVHVELHRPNGTTLKDEEAFSAAFRETIAILKEAGVHVWVLKQVPSHLLDISSSLGKAVFFRRNMRRLNRPLIQVLRRRAPIENAFATVKSGNLSFIDPIPLFCADGIECIVAANGHSLYKDDNHLTAYGAMWMQSAFEPVFKTRVGVTDAARMGR